MLPSLLQHSCNLLFPPLFHQSKVQKFRARSLLVGAEKHQVTTTYLKTVSPERVLLCLRFSCGGLKIYFTEILCRSLGNVDWSKIWKRLRLLRLASWWYKCQMYSRSGAGLVVCFLLSRRSGCPLLRYRVSIRDLSSHWVASSQLFPILANVYFM